MGSGFLEAVYQECLENDLAFRRIPYQSQVELKLRYREQTLEQTYKADLICYERILVELKTVSELADIHRGQVIHYL